MEVIRKIQCERCGSNCDIRVVRAEFARHRELCVDCIVKMSTRKMCSGPCKTEKDHSEFYQSKDRHGRVRIYSACKQCEKERRMKDEKNYR